MRYQCELKLRNKQVTSNYKFILHFFYYFIADSLNKTQKEIMKHVSILIPRGHTSLVNIEGTHQIFSEINNILKKMEKDPMFNIQLVGLSKETK